MDSYIDMIANYNAFQNINENKFTELKNKYNSLGEYVEHLYEVIDDTTRFSEILGQYLKIPAKKYNSKSFKEGDYVLIEYWYKDILTPVKILEKKGRKYTMTHNIEESEIKNAPDEVVKKDRIVDHFHNTDDNKKEKSINTDIRISNAVNMLNAYDQMLLVKKLQDEFSIEESVKFDLEDVKDMSVLGQTGFNSFMKIITALNLPDTKIDKENCPKDFFVIFISDKLNRDRLTKVMERFRSMNQINDMISKTIDPIRIYFGLKYNSFLMVEYGITKGEKRVVVGEYKLSARNWRVLSEKESKPLKSLQKQIENIDIKELKKLMKIKGMLTELSPGYFHEKSNPYIEDMILHQDYKGTGKWDNGTITQSSFNSIKTAVKEWIVKSGLVKDIHFKVVPENFWIKLKLKLIK